jgi:hypothetical protein
MTCTSSASPLRLQSKIEFFKLKLRGNLSGPWPWKMPLKRQRKELNRECLSPVNQGMPDVDDETPLLPAMEKACDNEEQREEKIM